MNRMLPPSDIKYFSMLPHLVNDMELSLQAFRLYARIIRRAGQDSTCFESEKSLAKACRMGRSSIVRSKAELVERGLIVIVKRKRQDGGWYDDITPCDIWPRNMAQYDKRESF